MSVMPTTYKLNIVSTILSIAKLLLDDVFPPSCFKHSRSLFSFESKMASSFKCKCLRVKKNNKTNDISENSGNTCGNDTDPGLPVTGAGSHQVQQVLLSILFISVHHLVSDIHHHHHHKHQYQLTACL